MLHRIDTETLEALKGQRWVGIEASIREDPDHYETWQILYDGKLVGTITRCELEDIAKRIIQLLDETKAEEARDELAGQEGEEKE